jgi:hypothetical protein
LKAVPLLLSVAVVVAVVIAAVYFLNTSGPAPVVAVTGKLPSNMTTIAESRPTISVEFTLQNINVEALSFSICLDGGAAAGMTKGASEAHFTPAYSLNDGVHNVSVNISSGSTLLSSVSWSFSVDASPPTITSLYPVNGTVYSEDLLLSVNFTDPTGVDLDRLTLLLDDVNMTGAAQISQGGLFYAPPTRLSEGTHNFTITLCDILGNNASYSWFLVANYSAQDSSPPHLVSFFPANNSIIRTPAAAVWFYFYETGSGIDPASIVLRINNVLPFNCTGSSESGWNVSYAGYFLDGTYSVSITVKDLRNNSVTEQIAFTVDATPPSVIQKTPSNGATLNASSVIISARFVDATVGVNLSSIKIMVGGNNVTSAAQISSSGFNYSATLQNGTYTVSLVISDLVGNVATATWSFTVAIPPDSLPQVDRVIILTKTGYYNTESGLPTIVGEVKNTGTTTVTNVLVEGRFLCNDGNVINNDGAYPAILYAYAEIEVLEPGEVSPFKIVMTSDFPDFDYILSQLKKFDASVKNMTRTSEVPYADYEFTNLSGGLVNVAGPLEAAHYHYVLNGTITNNGSTSLDSIKVVSTFYRPEGPMAVEYVIVSSLDPGEQASFTIAVEDNIVASYITRYVLSGSP